MTSIWTPHWGYQRGADEGRCRASVPDGGRSPTFHQCHRKPTVKRELDGALYGFCGQHDPVVVQAKRAAREAAWRAEWDERDRREEMRKRREAATNDCIDALRQIAAGHNDARALAAEVIARLDAA